MLTRHGPLAAVTLFLMAATASQTRPALAADADRDDSKLPTFQTAKVARGNLVVEVRASGPLEPEETVDVGAQVDGRVVRFGADRSGKPIDYGSQVAVGDILLEIDDTPFRIKLDAERAGLQVEQVKLLVAQAKLQSATAEFQRVLSLVKTNAASQADADAAKGNESLAKAYVTLAEAEIERQKLSVRSAQLNLDYTKIKSPTDGVIIDRRVNVGQNVSSSLSGPSLFLIASDLRKLQIWASVNEADIAQVQVGQNVQFGVDAFPDGVFKGTVSQIHNNAAMTQNVVTYTVVVNVDNPDGKLRPYLTADVRFEVAHRDNVMVVPSAALRWRPQPEWIAADARDKLPPARENPFPLQAGKTKAPRYVWILDGKSVRPVEVQLGISDGTTTEVRGGDLHEGDEVVVRAVPAVISGATGRDAKSSFDAEWIRAVQKTVQNDPALRRSLEQSAKAMQHTLDSMGSNLLMVLPNSLFSSVNATTLTVRDAEDIALRCPAAIEVAPIVRVRAQVTYRDRNWVPIAIYGTTQAFVNARDWAPAAEGNLFTDQDVLSRRNLCLVGETVKRELFRDEPAVGQEIRINNVAYRVVGVLSKKGASIVGMDQDDIVLAPWTAMKSRIADPVPSNANMQPTDSTDSPLGLKTATSDRAVEAQRVDQILVKVASGEQVSETIEQIDGLLRRRHRIKPGDATDFSIRDLNELGRAMLSNLNLLNSPR